MGELAARTIFSNDTGPLAGTGLDTLAKNQGAILELEGAQAPQSKTIASGSISPTSAYVIVDTEGSAAADDLDVISPVLSASENLHDGMIVYLKAADSGRVVTVKNTSSANGINTYDGNDYVLSTTHWLKLQLRAGKWYEVEGREMVVALAAATAAAAASTPATTTSRGIARVATLADMEPGAEVENGPAVLAAGSEALNALVPTFLIGSIISTYAADGYVPNGCVLPDGAEYAASQFPTFYTDYLTAGRVVTCTYAEFAAQIALTGNCGKFALDTVNHKFKVPLLKDGDSITHATSAAELGKSVKAGLPNITGRMAGGYGSDRGRTGVFSGTWLSANTTGLGNDLPGSAQDNGWRIEFTAKNSNPIYSDSVTTVLDEQVRLRHFVVVASAQNNTSVFDWSNYMAGLAGKANNNLSNLEPAAEEVIRSKMTLRNLGTRSTTGDWTLTDVKIGRPLWVVFVPSNNDYLCNIAARAVSGATIGSAVYYSMFHLGRQAGWGSTNNLLVKPTSTTVVLNISEIHGTGTIYAEQI